MSIISDESQIVNNYQQKSVENLSDVYQGEKWSGAKAASRKMAARLYAVGLQSRAARMWTCGDYLAIRESDDGRLIADAPQLCRDRLCPICSWRLSKRRFAEMMAVFNALAPEIIEHNYKSTMLTLTIKNMQLSDLRRAIDGMATAWHNLIRRELFRDAVGWARSLEITYNPTAKTYHPHMHIILIWDKYDNTQTTAEIIRDGWKNVCKIDYNPVIDIREVYSRNGENDKQALIKSALEAFKYAVKPDCADKIPQNDLFEFASAIKGVRFVSYGKSIKRARAALGFKNEESTDDSDVKNNMPDNTIIALLAWSGVKYARAVLTEGKWRLNPAELALAAAETEGGSAE